VGAAVAFADAIAAGWAIEAAATGAFDDREASHARPSAAAAIHVSLVPKVFILIPSTRDGD
jgi:hypothetical protein